MTLHGWRRCTAKAVALTSAVLCGGLPLRAHAMTGPWVDTAADVLAWVVLVLVPVAGIYLFWKVHVLPEIIAEKRHHPQKDAIKTLCILSLVFGGLLWPIAWLWAYSRPVLYKLAYGTEKHEDYYKERAPGVSPAAQEISRIRTEIDTLTKMGVEADDLKALRKELARLESRLGKADDKETG